MKTIEFDITPIPKPRMTQRDKWQQRPATERYRVFKENIKLMAAVNKFKMPESNFHVLFYLPIPKNVKGAARADMEGRKHQKRPDVDNLLKSVMDSLLKEDSHVWDCRATKLWGDKGKIVVRWENE